MVTGAVLLAFTLIVYLLVPVHYLSLENAEILSDNRGERIKQLDRVSPDGYVRRWTLVPAPARVRYPIRLSRPVLPMATTRLMGEMNIRIEALQDENVKEFFDGFETRILINGEERERAAFSLEKWHFRYFSVELPPEGEVAVEVVTDPGSAGDAAFDWAVIKDMRVKTSFFRLYLLSALLLVSGAAARFSGGRLGRVFSGPSPPSRIPFFRKLGYAVFTTLLFSVPALEAAYPRLARSLAFTSFFPALKLPGLSHVGLSPDWKYDPETGFVRRPDLDMEYRFLDGDLYHMHLTTVKGTEPIEVSFRTDSFGFRNQSPPEGARIAVLGDSFAEGPNVNRPFPRVLEETLSLPVYNLGTSCFGAAQEEIVLKRMLPRLQSLELVILTWYGINDPGDTRAFLKSRASGNLAALYDGILCSRVATPAPDRVFPLEKRLFGRVILLLAPGIAAWADCLDFLGIPGPAPSKPLAHPGLAAHWPEPVPIKKKNEFTVTPRSGPVEVALLPAELEQKFRGGPADEKDLETALEAVGRIRDLLAEGDVLLLVVDMPSKFETLRDLLGRQYPDSELAMRLYSLSDTWRNETPEAVLSRIDANGPHRSQRLAEYCRARGVAYLDLAPGFSRTAEEGLLYYPNDTHLNQAGHDLSAELIRAELVRLMFDPVSRRSP